MNAVTLVLAFFSSISLIVGGLMIINTMIVSVYERTHEIGITKDIGASEPDIIRFFLSECIIIGVLGRILGHLPGIFILLFSRQRRQAHADSTVGDRGFRTFNSNKCTNTCSRVFDIVSHICYCGHLSCMEGG